MSIAATTACVIVLGARASATPVVPENFVVRSLSPGLWFYIPTCLAFLPDGRALVGEKGGAVYLLKNGFKSSVPIWDGENEVLNTGDCGLVGIAVDPRFFENHYVYFSYTVDPDSNGVDSEENGFGRLVRYQMGVSDTNRIDLATRTILIGPDWPHGPLTTGTHTIGALRFGDDGSLLVAVGEGANPSFADAGGRNPDAFGPGKTDPSEDVGAFRSQDLGSMCGKILRIDPVTGHGLPDNPFYDGDPTSVQSRVWAYGFRNPFRFAVRPQSGDTGFPGTLYVGDAGWFTWEEIDIVAEPGHNFGWPCYEGPGENMGYQSAQPTRFGCSSMPVDRLTFPFASWPHEDSTLSNPPGILGNCAMGGVFYTGDRYPAAYRGRYFFADYGANWLRVATVDSLDHLTGLERFADQLEGPTDFAIDPSTGDVCYVSIAGSTVRRILYAGFANQAPIAAASTVSPDSGLAPLTVLFSSAGSVDIEGSPLYYLWEFGDGSNSDQRNPAHLYTTAGTYEAVLTVTDTLGGVGADTVVVRVTGPGAFPATAVVDDFNRANGPVGGSWVGNIAALAVADGGLTQTGPPSPSGVWSGQTFGLDQEAFVKLRTLAPSCRRYTLMLKVQGDSFSGGGIQVRYDQTLSTVEVSTNQPAGGWKVKGVLHPVTFPAGSVLGARVYRNGSLQVYRDHVKVGEVMLDNWAFNSSGGRIGIDLAGASGSRLDDFGGGTVFSAANSPPIASIGSPPPVTYFADEDTIVLLSASHDIDEPASILSPLWQVDLLHNNHVHPAIFTSNQPQDRFVVHNHDDGTGVRYNVKLIVTDGGGLSDTTSIMLWPDIDLAPSPVATLPDPPSVQLPVTYHFTLRNLGRMPAPRSRWSLRCDDLQLAAGDTSIAARDSVSITVAIPPQMATGVHTLQVVADTLGQVAESNESNNVSTVQVQYVSGPIPDATPPTFVQVPASTPFGGYVRLRWTTNEVTGGFVRFGIHPTMTDSVAAPPPFNTAHEVIIGSLTPYTRYYYAVTAIDLSGNRATAAIDSFVTAAGAVDRSPSVPPTLELANAAPNPSRGQVGFEIGLPRDARVQLRVFDLLGREVWRGVDSVLPAGRWQLGWPGTDGDGRVVRAGIYHAFVRVDNRTWMRRVAILR